jgi:hypothetical protein
MSVSACIAANERSLPQSSNRRSPVLSDYDSVWGKMTVDQWKRLLAVKNE